MANNPKPKSNDARSTQHPPSWYAESRKKAPSTDGAITFTVLRLLELPWQYYFLGSGLGSSLLTKLGATPQPLPPTAPSSFTLGLHPYHGIILALAAGTSFSQIFWVWGIRDNNFPPSGATAVALYNTLLNTLNSGLALWALTSQAPSSRNTSQGLKLYYSLDVAVGILMYMLGLYVERRSEIQRAHFKAKAENKGKPFAGGLFGYMRNANYAGYTLMRTGFALVCGGWVWAAVMGGMNFCDFAFRAVPWLEAYCEERYGRQWQEVKKKVPYRLIPYIY